MDIVVKELPDLRTPEERITALLQDIEREGARINYDALKAQAGPLAVSRTLIAKGLLTQEEIDAEFSAIQIEFLSEQLGKIRARKLATPGLQEIVRQQRIAQGN